ncbi:hypothetical protein GWG65_32635 [Bradyrhizobium sp. CSA207]|uniref:hypothetical protein n=1 Tax=Bradyrhizobium sp. CSA207 TaxID=2698826 RepID=UPI0023AF5E07|nr:hypothetical protein [Bradyrhizobium sp. CSA207]MDE5446073.1 hypothetical protein [Bradyrhizobium sp. CSA207]
MTNDPAFTISTPLAVAMFAQAPLLLLNQCRSPTWARLRSRIFEEAQPGIMNHTSRRAAANTNVERLVWYTTPSVAPAAGPFLPNQAGRLLHENCQRKMQEFKE